MRKRTKILLFVLFALFVSYRTIHYSARTQKESFERRLSGCVLVSKESGILYSKCGGHHSLEDGTKLNMNSGFLIGSVSKQFTAVALLKALQQKFNDVPAEKRLQNIKDELNKPISAFLTSEHKIWNDDMPNWANEVTLHQLLSHSSGIHDFNKLKSVKFKSEDGTYFYETPHKPYEILNLVKRMPLSFTPGTQYEYSNPNFLLSAEILEVLTNKTYDKAVQELLFTPLRMNNTYSNSFSSAHELEENDKNISDQLVYDQEDDMPKRNMPSRLFHLSNTKGVASIITSPNDLYRWNHALHFKKSVLPQELYDLMHADHISKEGYGTAIVPTLIGKMHGYGGRLGTYTCLLLFDPKRKISIIVLLNILEDEDKSRDWLGYRIMSRIVEKNIKDEF